ASSRGGAGGAGLRGVGVAGGRAAGASARADGAGAGVGAGGAAFATTAFAVVAFGSAAAVFFTAGLRTRLGFDGAVSSAAPAPASSRGCAPGSALVALRRARGFAGGAGAASVGLAVGARLRGGFGRSFSSMGEV